MSEKNLYEPFVMQETNNSAAVPQDVNLTGKENYLDIPALVRSIQRAEGEPDCFRRPKGVCKQLDCKWRRYCLEDGILGL